MALRWFVRLLVLACVPLVIFANPATAQAATVRGPASPLSIDLSDPDASGAGHEFACDLNGQWALDEGGASGVLTVKGDCVTGWYVEYQVQEIQSIMLSGAGGCTHTSSGVDDAETAWVLSLPTANPCEITSVTVNVCSHSTGGDGGGDGCWFVQQAWSILLPDAPAGGDCPLYSIGAPPRVDVTPSPGQSIDNWYDVYAKFPFAWKEGVGAQTLRVALIFRQNGGPLQYGWPGGANGFRVSTIANGQAVTGMSSVRASSYGHHSTYTYVGVQIRSDQNVFGGSLGDDWGTTQPDQCFFYFGEKVTNLDGTDMDEPAGPIGVNQDVGPVSEPEADQPLPPASEGGCTFRLSDPTTWLEGGICAAVGLLAAIWDTLKAMLGALLGLVSGIVTGILDGLGGVLTALFVPTVPISERIDTIQGAFTDKVPFTWLNSIASIPATIPDGTSARTSTATPEMQAASSVPDEGCPAWNVKVVDLDVSVICGSSFTDAIRNMRPVFTAFMAILAFWPMVRGMWYGAIPILNVKRGGSD